MRPLVYSDTITIRTNAELRAAIEAAAEREDTSASDWVRRALASVTRSANRHAHVPAESLPTVWPEIAGMIEAACACPSCDYTPASLRGIVERREGALLLILGDDGRPAAAAVTQVRQHENGAMSAWVLALGGRRTIPWHDAVAVIEARARMVPCSTIEFIGRPAWARILPDYVAAPCRSGVHYSKRLGH